MSGKLLYCPPPLALCGIPLTSPHFQPALSPCPSFSSLADWTHRYSLQMARGDKSAKKRRSEATDDDDSNDNSPEESFSTSDVHMACCRFTSEKTQEMILEQLLARNFIMDKNIKFNNTGFNCVIRGIWSLYAEHEDPDTQAVFQRLNSHEVSFVKNIKTNLASISKLYKRTDEERKKATEQMLGFICDNIYILTDIVEVFICVRLLLGLEGCFRIDGRIKKKDHKNILATQVKWLRSKKLLKDMTIESFTLKWINEERQSRVDGILSSAPAEAEHPSNICELRINSVRHLQHRTYLRENMRSDINAVMNRKIANAPDEITRLRAKVKLSSFFPMNYLKCERYIDALVFGLDPDQNLSSLLIEHCRNALIIEAELHCNLSPTLSGHCGLGCDFNSTGICISLVSHLSMAAKSYRLTLAGGEPDHVLAKYYLCHDEPAPSACLDIKVLPFKENELADPDEHSQLANQLKKPAIDFGKYLNITTSLFNQNYTSCAGDPSHSAETSSATKTNFVTSDAGNCALGDYDDLMTETGPLPEEPACSSKNYIPPNSTETEHNMRLLPAAPEQIRCPEASKPTSCVAPMDTSFSPSVASIPPASCTLVDPHPSDVPGHKSSPDPGTTSLTTGTLDTGTSTGASTCNSAAIGQEPVIFPLPRPQSSVNKPLAPLLVRTSSRGDRNQSGDDPPSTPSSENGSFSLSPSLTRALSNDKPNQVSPNRESPDRSSPDSRRPAVNDKPSDLKQT